MTTAGDNSETGELFTLYHDRIYRYIASLVRNPAEAEDLTQDTFLRAFCRRDLLRDPNAVRGWLYRIATHLSLDRLRQRRPLVSLDDEPGWQNAEAIVSGLPAASDFTERAETSACVQRCLDFLSDSYRVVLLLHESYSLTGAQIAALLDVSLPTVKIRLHRARSRLRYVMQHGCAISDSKAGVPCCEPKPSTEPSTEP